MQVALLRSAPVTAALASPELERLARALEPVSVASGELVCRQETAETISTSSPAGSST